MQGSDSRRLRSLDIFRGIAIASMIAVNNPGSDISAYAPLVHTAWSGWGFADTIFPAFMWIMGVSMTLATASRFDRGASRSDVFAHGIGRAAVLFGCGLFVEAFPGFRLAELQVTGVLQKIAICYLVASAVCLCTNRVGQVLAIVLLNALYCGVMMLLPVPGCTSGPWTVDCNAARYVNEVVLDGHMWRTSTLNDPEGLLTLLPATTSVLLGAVAGGLLGSKGPSRAGLRSLALVGFVLIASGQLLAIWIPINKTLWTTSYAILMAGISTAAFSILHWIVDLRDACRWLKPFEIFGMNALVVYVLSRLTSNLFKVHIAGTSLYTDVFARMTTPGMASLLYSMTVVAAMFLPAWYMYRRAWFIRL